MTQTNTADDLATSWCRMRTDRPALAADLVTDDFRLWSDTAPDGDAVVGPHDLARLVTRERERTGATITPTLVVGDDHRFAFTWDAVRPDGTVLTGVDVGRLGADAAIAAAWSITGERRNTVEAVAGSTTSTATMQRVCSQWTDLWNGAPELAVDLVTDDFRIWFGTNRSADDSILGPRAMADYVSGFRGRLGAVRFREDGDLVLDADRGRACVIWAVTLPAAARPDDAAGTGDLELGGIDLFQFADDRIARVWSITAVRSNTLPVDRSPTKLRQPGPK